MTSQTGRRVGTIVRAGGLTSAVVLLIAAAVGPATVTWTLSKPQIPQARNGSLAAESCPGTNACIAVGSGYSPSGPARTLAEAWNGTTWRIQATPNPPGSKGSNLDAVACPAATACTAVGTYVDSSGTQRPIAEAWNGSTWTIRATPDQPGSHGTVLDGVYCTAASACIAVGYYEDVSSQDYPQAFAESWNGQAWHILPAPDTAGVQSPLYAVSCTSPTTCIAVGAATSGTGVNAPLAAAWNGTAWTILPAIGPSGSSQIALNGVSCTAANACTAVGYYAQPPTFARHTLAEAWNGSSWKIQPTPNPDGYAGLAAVSCTAASACTAVGSKALTAPTVLAEAWNGSTWTAQQAPVPTGTSALTAVSCAANACGAAGYVGPLAGTRHALTEARTGSTWAFQPAISPRGALPASLGGVSCTSASSCVAVGTSTAQGWNGTRWRDLSAARPPGAASINLTGVSCATATACLAVGFYINSAGGLAMLAETWNGTAWTLHPPVRPGGAVGDLTSVSCSAPSACMAVGASTNTSGATLALAESWNGTAWTIRPTAQPANSDGSELNGVSCTAAGSCTAVGDYHVVRSSDLELAEAWNGTAWSVEPTPGTNGTRILNAVSCTAPGACAAVGYRGGGPLAETWNGTAWTAQTPPSPQNSFDVFLNGVSCVAASDCTATGSYSTGDTGFGMTLAEVWNGTAWHLQQTASPSNTEIVGLSGVSCMPGGACTAVGSYGPSQPGFGAFVPLAEQRN